MNIKKGFTLAEILIVLSIIGLVAEATIPVLVQDTKEKVTVTKVKKAYSILENAMRLASIENGPPSEWITATPAIDLDEDGNPTGTANRDGAENIGNVLKTALKVSKDCGMKQTGCLGKGKYKNLIGTDREEIDGVHESYKLLLIDGTSIGINTANFAPYNYCTINYGDTPNLKKGCATLFVDINGPAKPNQNGIDTFYFALTESAIVPFGTSDFRSDGNWNKDKGCNKTSAHKDNGYGCSAWVIQNENMDYLKCDDLSWDGKRSCD